MITSNGILLIKFFERCRLESYQDSAGVWTIGWGSTKGIKGGMLIDQAYADHLLIDQDLPDAMKRVDVMVKVPVQQCEQDSLISSAYNLRSFPALVQHLNAEGRTVYLDKLLLYCHDVQGHTLPGLKYRRCAERWMFEGMLWATIEKKIVAMRNQNLADVPWNELQEKLKDIV